MFKRLQNHKSFKTYRKYTEPFDSKQNQLKNNNKSAMKKNKKNSINLERGIIKFILILNVFNAVLVKYMLLKTPHTYY